MDGCAEKFFAVGVGVNCCRFPTSDLFSNIIDFPQIEILDREH